MHAVIDKVEGAYIRCLLENGDVLRLHKSRLPENITVGDVLKVSLELDADATKHQRELMAKTNS
ncbi:MAG: DUF3006 domain-containing protein [Candidatus Ozemobacteraceae bacterium]